MSDPTTEQTPSGDLRPMSDLLDSGLLWLINRVVFHPRGVALALWREDTTGDVTAWRLLAADDGEPFTFSNRDDENGFRRAEATLRAALIRQED